jgi:NADH-quinone oxidoreductase subunit C
VATVTVPAAGWLAALEFARDELGCDFFDWLTAVDEQDAGLAVVAHVYSLAGRHHLLLRTVLAGEPRLASAAGVYRGAAWHERETAEMFGVDFVGHPHLVPLLLPDGFEGRPLRKEFVLAARAVKPWPGAKEPGESDHDAPARRRTLPPGVPDPDVWGPRAADPGDEP